MTTASLATFVALVLAASISSISSVGQAASPVTAVVSPAAGSAAHETARVVPPAASAPRSAVHGAGATATTPGGGHLYSGIPMSLSHNTRFAPADPRPLPPVSRLDLPPKLPPAPAGFVRAEGIARTPTVVGYQSTGVGNHFSLATTVGEPYVAPGRTATARPIVGTVRYSDTASYFEGAGSVEAVVVLHVRTMTPTAKDAAPVAVGPATERTVHVLLTKEDGRYVGTFQTTASGTAGKSEEQIDSMDLAFVGNGKWDSNLGTNYQD